MLLVVTEPVKTTPPYLYEAVEAAIANTPLSRNNVRVVESPKQLYLGNTYSFVPVHKFVGEELVLGVFDFDPSKTTGND